jgi:hypothetical protein
VRRKTHVVEPDGHVSSGIQTGPLIGEDPKPTADATPRPDDEETDET